MNPREFHDRARRIQAGLAKAEGEFRWLYSAAYGHHQTASGTGGGGKNTGVSRPTEDATIDRGRAALRKKVQEADKALTKIAKAAEALRIDVTLSYRLRDVRGLPETKPTVTKDELSRVKAAADRRAKRGEGYGES